MDYVDVPKLNNVPVAVTTTLDEDKIVKLGCSNLAKYTFKFNEMDEFEYCIYRNTDMQETSDIEKIPDFNRALDMATYEITHTRIRAKGK